MKTFLFFLLVLTFLPALLLSPDVTYPNKSVIAETGEVIIKNTVLPIKGEKNIRHQITVFVTNENLKDSSCRPRAKYLKVSSEGKEFEPTVFSIWTAEDDQYANQNQVVLVTANYDSIAASTIKLNLGIFANSDCGTEVDEYIRIEITKKMKRWWPWNIVSDLIYSV